MRRTSSRQQRRSIPKLRPTPPHGKPRPRKRRAYAHFGWPRKRPTRILQIATRRQRKPVDLSRAGALQDLGLQIHQNPSNQRAWRHGLSQLAKIGAEQIPFEQPYGSGLLSSAETQDIVSVCIVCILPEDEQQGSNQGAGKRRLETGPVTGSHHHFKHPVKPGVTTVPHPRRDIPVGTLRSIERQGNVKLR